MPSWLVARAKPSLTAKRLLPRRFYITARHERINHPVRPAPGPWPPSSCATAAEALRSRSSSGAPLSVKRWHAGWLTRNSDHLLPGIPDGSTGLEDELTRRFADSWTWSWSRGTSALWG